MPTRAPSHSKVTWGRRVKDRAYQQQQKWRAEQQIYKTLRWRKLRARVLREQPRCSDPYGWHVEDHRIVPAVQVDHMVPLRVDQGLAYVRGNLQGLCARCHRVKTQDDLARFPIAVDRLREISTIRSGTRGIRGSISRRKHRMSEPGHEEEPDEAGQPGEEESPGEGEAGGGEAGEEPEEEGEATREGSKG